MDFQLIAVGVGVVIGLVILVAHAEQSASFFNLACRAGHSNACHHLGMLYEDGIGVPKNETTGAQLFEAEGLAGAERALEFFRKGCTSDRPDLCREAGEVYEKGEMVPRDLIHAEAFYRLACEGGDKKSCEAVAQLGKIRR